MIKHHSTGATRLSGTPTINTRIFSYLYEDLPGATQGSDTKTLQSLLLLRYLRLDSTIPTIYKFSYATGSSPRSKCCNAIISMQVVIDSGGYLYMAIPTIMRHDLGGYKEIILVTQIGSHMSK